MVGADSRLVVGPAPWTSGMWVALEGLGGAPRGLEGSMMDNNPMRVVCSWCGKTIPAHAAVTSVAWAISNGCSVATLLCSSECHELMCVVRACKDATSYDCEDY